MDEPSSHGTDRTSDGKAEDDVEQRCLSKAKSLPVNLPATSNVANNNLQISGKSGSKDGVGSAVAGGTAIGGCSVRTRSGVDAARLTLRQHYYPEGGWGWIVCVAVFLVNMLTTGLQYSYGSILLHIVLHFSASLVHAAWLGATCMASSLLLAPLVVATCRLRSARILAVIGGLIVSLGCLFTSFATRYHQILLSFGLFLGFGTGLTRQTGDLMIGQYFKRRRELVEVITHSGSACGLVLYSLVFKITVQSIGWRLGLQAITGMLFATFLTGLCYRSASLYHPQRRAIQHLKNQRRKVKEKVSHQQKHPSDKPPFFDLSVLSTRCLRVLIICCAISSFGLYSPLIFLVYILDEEGLDETSITLLQTFLGMAMCLGHVLFGYIIIQDSPQCRISRIYLAQICLVCLAVSVIALISLQGYHGYVLCIFMYGIFFGGYLYSVKMHLYERVKTRNFDKAWGFLQAGMAIPTFIGIGVTGHIMNSYGPKVGLYLSITSILISSILHVIILSLQSNVQSLQNSSFSTSNQSASLYQIAQSSATATRNRATTPPTGRELCKCLTESSGRPVTDIEKCDVIVTGAADFGNSSSTKRAASGELLTCISEEGLVDNYLLDDMYHENCITSCNKVEKYLMMSEFENNVLNNQVPPTCCLRKADTLPESPEVLKNLSTSVL